MKIYQKQYIDEYDAVSYKMRELKDIGEELYNIDTRCYLVITTSTHSKFVTVKLFSLLSTRLYTWMFANNEYLIENIKAVMRDIR